MPLTGCAAFFVLWMLLLASSVAYCLTVFRSIMYFVGMCFYVCAMVDDLAKDLDGFDKSLSRPSAKRLPQMDIQRDLAQIIRFHNEIIEYVASFDCYSIISLALSVSPHHAFYCPYVFLQIST